MKYSIGFLKSDLFGGISVAILSIPIAVAFAEIAHMPPESGIYTAVFALLAYFLLGSSRHAIIGTDFPTITLFAAIVIAKFGAEHGSAPQLMMMITVMAGIWMFVAGALKLGFIANFLSKPVLLAYLNGVSLVLIVSQIDKFTGIGLNEEAFLRRIAELVSKLQLINWPTLILGVVSLAFLLYFPKVSTRFPAAILLFIVTMLLGKAFDLGSMGVAFMPAIGNPYPNFVRPDLGLFAEHFADILFASGAVMFVSYASALPVVRGFSKDPGSFDANKELYAFGLAHVLIGFFGGYPVSADDSRTAVNIAVGGKTKFVNLIAAILILVTVFVVPGILTAIPLVTTAAVIMSAGIGMFERGAGLRLFKHHRSEFWVFAVCVVGVLTLGVYQGIVFAIMLAIIQIIRRSAKPKETELVYDRDSARAIHESLSPATDDEVLIYRFGSALLFYNAEHFAERVARLSELKEDLKLVIIDAAPINMIDLTALAVLSELIRQFKVRNVDVVFAGADASVEAAIAAELETIGLEPAVFYPSIEVAYGDFLSGSAEGAGT